jgi:hypothetical protein
MYPHPARDRLAIRGVEASQATTHLLQLLERAGMSAVVHEGGFVLQKILCPLLPWRLLLNVLVENGAGRSDSINVSLGGRAVEGR